MVLDDSDIPFLVISHCKKEVLGAINLSFSVTVDRYTRYYVNQIGGGEIGPVYRASFRVQTGNGIGPFFRRLPFC